VAVSFEGEHQKCRPLGRGRQGGRGRSGPIGEQRTDVRGRWRRRLLHVVDGTGLPKGGLDIGDRIVAWTFRFCEPVGRCGQGRNCGRPVAPGRRRSYLDHRGSSAVPSHRGQETRKGQMARYNRLGDGTLPNGGNLAKAFGSFWV
jgi:hypothetical protein